MPLGCFINGVGRRAATIERVGVADLMVTTRTLKARTSPIQGALASVVIGRVAQSAGLAVRVGFLARCSWARVSLHGAFRSRPAAALDAASNDEDWKMTVHSVSEVMI